MSENKFKNLSTPPYKTNNYIINTKVLSMGEDLGEGSARRVKINESTTLSPLERVASAFTLAEVLITLVIIGVIAAITVPTMIAKYQKEQTVVRLKKVYSTLSQTIVRAIADNGPMDTWELGTHLDGESAHEFVKKYIFPYLSISKDCGIDTTESCSTGYKNMNGNGELSNYDDKWTRFYLNDGASVTAYIRNNGHDKRLVIRADINGNKSPNILGKDIFEFNYFIDTTLPNKNLYIGKILPWSMYYSRATNMRASDSGCNKLATGAECSAVIIKDGWRIADDYPW